MKNFNIKNLFYIHEPIYAEILEHILRVYLFNLSKDVSLFGDDKDIYWSANSLEEYLYDLILELTRQKLFEQPDDSPKFIPNTNLCKLNLIKVLDKIKSSKEFEIFKNNLIIENIII